MSRQRPAVTALVVLSLLAFCSCSEDEGGGAVASGPLQGTFRGAPFVGKRAHATRNSPSTKVVDIVEADVECAKSAEQKQGIAVIVTWQTGYTREFTGDGSATANAAVYYDDNGTRKNDIASEGRVELVESSPEKGSKGRLRLRLITANSHIEGEIGLEVCD